jgi:hypothetical protein
MPAGYRCPLCDHEHRGDFQKSSLFDSPVCEMCMDPLESWAWEDGAELEYRLVRELLDRTERSWDECRVAILQDELNLWLNKHGNEVEDAHQESTSAR